METSVETEPESHADARRWDAAALAGLASTKAVLRDSSLKALAEEVRSMTAPPGPWRSKRACLTASTTVGASLRWGSKSMSSPTTRPVMPSSRYSPITLNHERPVASQSHESVGRHHNIGPNLSTNRRGSATSSEEKTHVS